MCRFLYEPQNLSVCFICLFCLDLMLIDIAVSHTNTKMNSHVLSIYIYEKAENKYMAFKGAKRRNSVLFWFGFFRKDDCCKDYEVVRK